MDEFLDNDLGYQDAGVIVEVDLDAQANVVLLDQRNFYSYKAGLSFHHYGGWATRSPIRFTIPYSEHWHVCVDLGGYGGSVNVGVRVINPLKVIRRNIHFTLDNRSNAFYDQLANGQFVLRGIVKDGMPRYHGNDIFDSEKELISFCYDYDSSKY